jgi:hypothetical protein
MPDGNFAFRVSGREHRSDDVNCLGCESIDNREYPRPHRDFGTNCRGLVHAERVADDGKLKTVLSCDVCRVNPTQSLRWSW